MAAVAQVPLACRKITLVCTELSPGSPYDMYAAQMRSKYRTVEGAALVSAAVLRVQAVQTLLPQDQAQR